MCIRDSFWLAGSQQYSMMKNIRETLAGRIGILELYGEVKKYELLDKASLTRGSGGIVCMCEEVIPIDSKNSFIPCNLI